MSKITYEEVVAAATELVKVFGADYVYPEVACTYQINGEPSCIVGHIVNRLDPKDFKKLVEYENREGARSFAIGEPSVWKPGSKIAHPLAAAHFETPSDEIRKNFEPKAFRFLEDVQRHQDNHASWGEALEKAKEAAIA